MESDRGKFYVEVISNDEPMTVIMSKDRKQYICAEQGQSFILRIKQRRTPADHAYGVKVYIDGREVNKIKTFKSYCHIFGFKLGGGRYKKFLFDIPPLKNEYKTDGEVRENNREFGKIKIVFYKTEKIKSKKRQKKYYNTLKYEQSVREEGLKFYERPLSIKEGDEYTIENKYKINQIDNYYDNNGYIEDYIIDYNREIDKLEFHYTDFFALQIKGIISMTNIDHLKYIPTSLLQKEDYVLEVLKVILRNKLKIHYEKIEEEFEKCTQRKLAELFQYMHITNFLQNYTLVFAIDEFGKVSLTNKEEICRKLRTGEMPIKPDRKYLEIVTSNKDSYKSKTPSEGESNKSTSDDSVIPPRRNGKQMVSPDSMMQVQEEDILIIESDPE